MLFQINTHIYDIQLIIVKIFYSVMLHKTFPEALGSEAAVAKSKFAIPSSRDLSAYHYSPLFPEFGLMRPQKIVRDVQDKVRKR